MNHPPITEMLDLSKPMIVEEHFPSGNRKQHTVPNTPQCDMREAFISIVNRIRAKNGHGWQLHYAGATVEYQSFFGNIEWPVILAKDRHLYR